MVVGKIYGSCDASAKLTRLSAAVASFWMLHDYPGTARFLVSPSSGERDQQNKVLMPLRCHLG